MLYRNRPLCKYYFTLPDDFMICDTQIAKAIEIWKTYKTQTRYALIFLRTELTVVVGLALSLLIGCYMADRMG